MILHHERLAAAGAEPAHWLMFLHGIFGSARNWASVARRVVTARPEWGAVLLDLRQHGRSVGFSGPHSLAAAAADVEALAEAESIDTEAVLGHSFGGKVALLHVLHAPRPPRQLWLVDSSPEAQPPGGSTWKMVELLGDLPSTFADRSAGVLALEERGVARPVAQWMATNLVPREGGGVRWRIDVRDMESLLLDFFRTDAWQVLEAPPPGLQIHVVKALGSRVLDGEALARVEEAARRTGRVHVHSLPGGHWLNAENPDGLVDLLVEWLPGRDPGPSREPGTSGPTPPR